MLFDYTKFYLMLRVGDVVFLQYYCSGFFRSFEGICLRTKGSIILRNEVSGLIVELVIFKQVVCIVTVILLNFKRKFLLIKKARLFFIRRGSRMLSIV
jgi:ribosomal protein L19